MMEIHTNISFHNLAKFQRDKEAVRKKHTTESAKELRSSLLQSLYFATRCHHCKRLAPRRDAHMQKPPLDA